MSEFNIIDAILANPSDTLYKPIKTCIQPPYNYGIMVNITITIFFECLHASPNLNLNKTTTAITFIYYANLNYANLYYVVKLYYACRN